MSTRMEVPEDHTATCKAIGEALTITGEQVRAALPATALRSALAAASMRLTAAHDIAHRECIVRMEQEDHPSPVPRGAPPWNTGVHAGGVR